MLMHGRRRVVEEYVLVGSSLLGPLFGFLGRTGYMCVIGRACIYCVFVLFLLCTFILISYTCNDYCHIVKIQLQ
jgi:hypothetical protein